MPSEATSSSSDQPPAGRTNGQPGSAAEQQVAPPLELVDALLHVALVAAQHRRRGRRATEPVGMVVL